MLDNRIVTLAQNLVNYSCNVKKGEKVLIEANGIDSELITELIKEIYNKSAFPFVNLYNSKVQRALLWNMSEEHAKQMAKYGTYQMQDMNAYIGIRGGNNAFELSDVDPKKRQFYDKFYSHPVHHEIRVGKTKWVVLRYPTEGMSSQSKMSTEAFTDLYFKVCNLDYAKMDKAMDPLKELMLATDKVRIVGKGTDLSFSIKGIDVEKCSGLRNIPDGEIYTAPVKDSVSGVISYNTPSIENGFEYKDVKLTFKNGKIIEATANNTEGLNHILDTDEGARYIGEFALGVNPYIEKPMGDILFDEKISGSFHFTPGACYEDANNGNNSAIHWDLVCIQTKEFGGGEIYFDDKLIRKDGIFVLDSLKCLNKENLM